jgi:cytoskeletal protein CcmA (bactofilin family)
MRCEALVQGGMAMGNPYDNAADKLSVLGPTLVFKGELSADEDLMLKGRVEGSINHTASLRIGKEGSVVGNITAKFITVEGRVEGDLHGSGAVTVKESANIDGNIFSPTVSLLEGANFNGSIEMKKKRAEAAQAPRSGESGSPESRPAARSASGSR